MPLNLVKPLQGNPRRVRGFLAHVKAGPAGAWHGIDDAVVVGTPLIAMDDGTISNVQKLSTGGGWNFQLQFSKYKGWFGWYAHCSVLPTNGQVVKRGQVIGKSGNTGGSTGPHLHWSLLQNGIPRDPDNPNVAIYTELGGDPMLNTDYIKDTYYQWFGKNVPQESLDYWKTKDYIEYWNGHKNSPDLIVNQQRAEIAELEKKLSECHSGAKEIQGTDVDKVILK